MNLFSGPAVKETLTTLQSDKESANFGGNVQVFDSSANKHHPGRGMSIHDLTTNKAAADSAPFAFLKEHSSNSEEPESATRVHEATNFSMNLTKQSYKDQKPPDLEINTKPGRSDDALTSSVS